MLLELGIVGGVVGLFMARNTKPVKGVINGTKKLFVKSKIGQSIILSNAKDTIKTEFIKEKESIREDAIELEVEKRSLLKKEEYLQFLEYAISDEELGEEEKMQFQKEKEVKDTEIKVLRESILEKEQIINRRVESLGSYEVNVLDKRLAEAEIAEIIFKQQNCLNKLQNKLEEVEHLGESTMTNSVISRYLGDSAVKSKISVNRRYELMEKYNKGK